jgi:hypothetical protein
MNQKEKVAAIKAILVENAALLNEPQNIFYRRLRSGVVRIQQKRYGTWERKWQDYPTIDAAYEAAQIASQRAHERTGK